MNEITRHSGEKDPDCSVQFRTVPASDYSYLNVASAEPPFIIEQPPDLLYTVNHSVGRDFNGGNPHLHLGYYEIYLFLEGKAGFFLDGKHHQLQPYDLVIIPPNTLHKEDVDLDVDYGRIIIHLSQTLLRLLSTAKTDFPSLLQKYDSNYIRLFTKTFGITPRKYAMANRNGAVFL